MMIPTFFVDDMSASTQFYTQVLDFTLAESMPVEAPFYCVLVRDGDELHLSLRPGERPVGPGTAIVVCNDVDAVFAGARLRGLKLPGRLDSPVHAGPVDQTWGTREFYVDDPSGNTLVFQQQQARS